ADLANLADVKYEGRKAIVCLVGENLRETPGIAARVFGELSDVKIRMISQGASEINLTFVVEEDVVLDVVRRLHKTFFSDLDVEIARERGHEVSVLTGKENPSASALTPERLSKINVVLDFTTPEAVLDNIFACIRSRTNIVVGTTGWYKELDRVRQEVESSGTGLLYSQNLFIGVNILYDAEHSAVAALKQGIFGQFFE